MKILFVCTGNTCRSPMAQALASQLLGEKYHVVSAGLMAMPNASASANAIAVMHEQQLDLIDHKAQLVTEKLLEEADLILTMTENHKGALIQAVPDKVYTLGEYAGCNTTICDPFGRNLSEYKKCADEIYGLLLKIKDKINLQI
ncbi:MAG: low molecular weight protein arginine phosphatase [Defluviitaleaceae bacterium]|nr:low molecular weight protein arginine phosphatase [Defluviitaleaceae bacterium]